MTSHPNIPRRTGERNRPIVVALHCSGATGRQWRRLADELSATHDVIAPDLIGAPGCALWSGERPFTWTDDVQFVVDMIDAASAPVHLVGHSSGGAVALKAALLRPVQTASLTLYEPTSFHLAEAGGSDARALVAEVRRIATAMEEAVLAGAYSRAAELFVDYWGGDGVYAGLRQDERRALAQHAPKACLDFRALFAERTPISFYRRISAPTLIMQGVGAKPVTAYLASRLARFIPASTIKRLEDAGHMGPFTHQDAVAKFIADHVRRASLASRNAPARGEAA